VLTEVAGLTQAELAARQLLVVEADRALKFAQADTDKRKKALADLEAQVKTAAILRAEFERTDALGGLTKGFRDAADAAESTGRIMQDFGQTTARSIQQSFSNEFFAVITGEFKKLPELSKTFGLSMVRAFTDALAQSATAPFLRLLGGRGL